MKKEILVILFAQLIVCSSLAQSNEEIVASNLDGKILSSGNFIDALNAESKNVVPFHKVSTTEVRNESGVFTVHLYYYKGWENEGGGCNVIEIQRNGEKLMQLENSDAWDANRFELKELSKNGYYISVSINPTTTILFFEGFVRGSQPAPVTIIALNKDGARVLFNRSYIVNEFNKTTNSFSLDLWDDADSDLADHFRLWLDNNTIKFQKK